MFCSFCVLRTRPCVALIWARSTALPITQKTYIDIGIYGVFSLAVSGTGKNGTRTGLGKNDEWVTHPFSGSENIPRDEFQLFCCRPQAKFWAKQCYYTPVSFCFQRPSRQTPPWTETTCTETPCTETPDKDPQRKTPRDPPGQRPPSVVTIAGCTHLLECIFVAVFLSLIGSLNLHLNCLIAWCMGTSN